jgi:hypothetical protein
MYLEGVRIADSDLLELALLLREAGFAAEAHKLEDAYRHGDETTLALTIQEREAIIRALEDAPVGLEELRAALLQEHVWRQREET